MRDSPEHVESRLSAEKTSNQIPTMKTETHFTQGAKVTGKYFGAQFTGTVIAARDLTVRPFAQSLFIAFDAPVNTGWATRTEGGFALTQESAELGCEIALAS